MVCVHVCMCVFWISIWKIVWVWRRIRVNVQESLHWRVLQDTVFFSSERSYLSAIHHCISWLQHHSITWNTCNVTLVHAINLRDLQSFWNWYLMLMLNLCIRLEWCPYAKCKTILQLVTSVYICGFKISLFHCILSFLLHLCLMLFISHRKTELYSATITK